MLTFLDCPFRLPFYERRALILMSKNNVNNLIQGNHTYIREKNSIHKKYSTTEERNKNVLASTAIYKPSWRFSITLRNVSIAFLAALNTKYKFGRPTWVSYSCRLQLTKLERDSWGRELYHADYTICSGLCVRGRETNHILLYEYTLLTIHYTS